MVGENACELELEMHLYFSGYLANFKWVIANLDLKFDEVDILGDVY